jgi:hypothetical protein
MVAYKNTKFGIEIKYLRFVKDEMIYDTCLFKGHRSKIYLIRNLISSDIF